MTNIKKNILDSEVNSIFHNFRLRLESSIFHLSLSLPSLSVRQKNIPLFDSLFVLNNVFNILISGFSLSLSPAASIQDKKSSMAPPDTKPSPYCVKSSQIRRK